VTLPAWDQWAAAHDLRHRAEDSVSGRVALGLPPLRAARCTVRGWSDRGLVVRLDRAAWRASGRLTAGRQAELDRLPVEIVGHRVLRAAPGEVDGPVELYVVGEAVERITIAGLSMRLEHRRGLSVLVPASVDADVIAAADTIGRHLGVAVPLILAGRVQLADATRLYLGNDPSLVRFSDGAAIVATD
jgi:hypothetical protein